MSDCFGRLAGKSNGLSASFSKVLAVRV